MGVPIVAARLPSLSGLFSERAIAYFEPGSADDLAARALELHADAELRPSLVAHADAEFVEARSWQDEAGKYLEVVRRLGLQTA